MMQNILATFILVFSFLVGTITADKVRHGTHRGYDEKVHTIGVVDSKTVYLAIPEYKQIKTEGVTEGSARYFQLMKQATDRYHITLKKTAKQGGYYVLVEKGGVQGYPTTNVTELCISNL